MTSLGAAVLTLAGATLGVETPPASDAAEGFARDRILRTEVWSGVLPRLVRRFSTGGVDWSQRPEPAPGAP
jgi:hypothetical protein